MSRLGGNGVLCGTCGKTGYYWNWNTYHCAFCGAPNLLLLRKEHAEPEVAAHMTDAELLSELAEWPVPSDVPATISQAMSGVEIRR